MPVTQKGYKNILLDIPPFGRSDEIEGWSLFTYVDMVVAFCQYIKVEKINIIAHSFGGRVAILISSLYPKLVDKLVLVGSAGMKPKRKLTYYMRIFAHKSLKILGFSNFLSGSSDYAVLNSEMKKTFINIVNTYLEDYCKKITASTLIIFGENDAETPIYMAQRLHKLIASSKLKILPHAGHFVYLDRSIEFNELVSDFLKEEK